MTTTVSDNNRRIARNTLMLYIRMFLIMGVTLYTSRVVLNQLGVVDYGIYNVVGGIVVMFSFLNGAMAQSTQRFFSYEMGRDNITKLKDMFSTSMTIHTIIAGIIVILAETLGLWFLNTQMSFPDDRAIPANIVYQCSILSFVVSILQVPYNASIISHEKMQTYAYISIIEVILKLGIAFFLIILAKNKLIIYAVMVLGVSIVINLTYRAYCRHNFQECHYQWNYNKKLVYSMSGYAAWSTVGSFAWIGKSQGCNLILNIFLGPMINAAYGITNQINTALNSFVQNFTTAINPQIVKSYAAEDYNRCYSLVYYGCKVSFFLMLILSVPVLLTTDKILVIWLKNVPDYTVIFTKLIILNSLLESFTYCMSTPLQASGKIKSYQIVVGVSILLNLPVSYFLLRTGNEPYSIFIASIIISIITLGERLWIMNIVLVDFSVAKFVGKVFLPGFIVSAIIFIIYTPLYHIYRIDDIGFVEVITLSIILTGVIVFLIGFNRYERKSIINTIKLKL